MTKKEIIGTLEVNIQLAEVLLEKKSATKIDSNLKGLISGYKFAIGLLKK
jgi:hypothetical protein